MSTWDFMFVLPNLTLGAKSPFRSASAAIVSASEARKIVQATDANRTGLEMLRRFKNAHGKRVSPSCLVVDPTAFKGKPPADVLQAFRNCCAVATVATSKAEQLASQSCRPSGNRPLFRH